MNGKQFITTLILVVATSFVVPHFVVRGYLKQFQKPIKPWFPAFSEMADTIAQIQAQQTKTGNAEKVFTSTAETHAEKLERLEGELPELREQLDEHGRRMDDLQEQLDTYTPVEPTKQTAEGEKAAAEISWHTDPKAAWAEAEETGKPVLVTFTMDHRVCLPCMVLATQVLSRPEVAAELSRFVLLEVHHPEAAKWRVKRYPRVAVFAPDRQLLKQWTPRLGSAQDFLTHLESIR